jgi:predicted nucleotide-binding protein (sugar kinase/HSP70/actin superfamily)
MKQKEQLFGELFFSTEMKNSKWQKAYENFSKSKEELEKEQQQIKKGEKQLCGKKK